MTLQVAQFVSRAIVLGTAAIVPAVWIAWDVYAYRKFGRLATESHYIWKASQDHPWVFLVIFLLAATLLWHITIGPEPTAALMRAISGR